MNGDSTSRTPDEQAIQCPVCSQLVFPAGGAIPQHFVTVNHTHRYECSASLMTPEQAAEHVYAV